MGRMICRVPIDFNWPLQKVWYSYELADEELSDPPDGPAYQVWETVSNGSPVSPPFLAPEDLARWMVEHDNSSTKDVTYAEWVDFIREIQSAVSMDNGASGVKGSVLRRTQEERMAIGENLLTAEELTKLAEAVASELTEAATAAAKVETDATLAAGMAEGSAADSPANSKNTGTPANKHKQWFDVDRKYIEERAKEHGKGRLIGELVRNALDEAGGTPGTAARRALLEAHAAEVIAAYDKGVSDGLPKPPAVYLIDCEDKLGQWVAQPFRPESEIHVETSTGRAVRVVKSILLNSAAELCREFAPSTLEYFWELFQQNGIPVIVWAGGFSLYLVQRKENTMHMVVFCDVDICIHYITYENVVEDDDSWEDKWEKEKEEYENARKDIDEDHVGIEVAIHDYDLASIGGIPEALRGYDTEPLIEGKPKSRIRNVSEFSATCFKLHDMSAIQFVTLMTPIFRRDWDFFVLHNGWWISSEGFYNDPSARPISQAERRRLTLDRANAWALAMEKERKETPTDQAATEE